MIQFDQFDIDLDFLNPAARARAKAGENVIAVMMFALTGARATATLTGGRDSAEHLVRVIEQLRGQTERLLCCNTFPIT
ncbi:MAG: hypothetical protein ACR2JI_07930 [Mycobacterium sp.]